MPYKLTPGEVREKFTAYMLQCDNRVRKVRRGTIMVAMRRPAVYDMEEFCGFAGLDPRTLPAMAQSRRYRQAVLDIRCAVLQRKLLALKNSEVATGPLAAELGAVYGLHAKKIRCGNRMQWQVAFGVPPAGKCAPATPAAAVTLAVLQKAGLQFFANYMPLHKK